MKFNVFSKSNPPRIYLSSFPDKTYVAVIKGKVKISSDSDATRKSVSEYFSIHGVVEDVTMILSSLIHAVELMPEPTGIS